MDSKAQMVFFSLGTETIISVFDSFRNKIIEKTMFSLHPGMQKEIQEQHVYLVSEVDKFGYHLHSNEIIHHAFWK